MTNFIDSVSMVLKVELSQLIMKDYDKISKCLIKQIGVTINQNRDEHNNFNNTLSINGSLQNVQLALKWFEQNIIVSETLINDHIKAGGDECGSLSETVNDNKLSSEKCSNLCSSPASFISVSDMTQSIDDICKTVDTSAAIVQLNESISSTNLIKTDIFGRQSLGSRQYKNRRCEYDFPMSIVNISVNGRNKFKCELCDYSSKLLTTVRLHYIRRHRPERPHSCDDCKAKFAMEKDLMRHKRLKHSSRFQLPEYACDCGRLFQSEKSLKRHQRHYKFMPHSRDDGPQSCNICSKVFVNIYVMRYHKMRMHANGILPTLKSTYICSRCGKQFSSKYSLRDHEYSHDKFLAYKCDFSGCNQAFSWRSRLRLHQQLQHLNIKKICEECGKDFTRSAALRVHQRIHRKQRDFVCSHCGKAFNQHGALLRHERIHTGVKPFRCDVCEFATSDKSVLRRHNTRHERHTDNSNSKQSKKRSVKKQTANKKLPVSVPNINVPINELDAWEQKPNASTVLHTALNDSVPLIVSSLFLEDSPHHNEVESQDLVSCLNINSSDYVADMFNDENQLTAESLPERNPPPQLFIIADDMTQVNDFISQITEHQLFQHQK